jgi:acyl-CoA dehydrogenase
MIELDLITEAVADMVTREDDATAVWAAMVEAGVHRAGLTEDAGGTGLGLVEAATVIRLLARHGIPTPIAETAFLAGWLLETAGLPIEHDALAVVASGVRLQPTGDTWVLNGRATRVPWARDADAIVVLAEGHVACVPRRWCGVAQGENVAGEPRDTVHFDDVALPAAAVAPNGSDPLASGGAPAGSGPLGNAAATAAASGPLGSGGAVSAAALAQRGALARAVAMSGAIDGALELTVAYVQERRQFGRPIGAFQAVQQELALMAGEAAAARAAVDAAIAQPDLAHVAAAKVRAGEAAGVVARIAHQLHGAIGYTQEHELHTRTRPLWAWRDEHGNEDVWARRLGEWAVAMGADQLWPRLTRDDPYAGAPR